MIRTCPTKLAQAEVKAKVEGRGGKFFVLLRSCAFATAHVDDYLKLFSNNGSIYFFILWHRTFSEHSELTKQRAKR